MIPPKFQNAALSLSHLIFGGFFPLKGTIHRLLGSAFVDRISLGAKLLPLSSTDVQL